MSVFNGHSGRFHALAACFLALLVLHGWSFSAAAQTPDVTPPVALRAYNVGTNILRVVFDEPVALPEAGAFSLSPSLSITTVTAGLDPHELDLTTDSFSFGTTYQLTLNGIEDTAVPANVIGPNTTLSFTAAELAPQNIGTATLTGSFLRRTDGFDITAGGTDIGKTSDQFQFSWERLTGNFDHQVRVAGATISSAWLRAGLMARESLTANSRFAAIFSSSAQLGSFFESRATTGVNATRASIPGGFPANHPNGWLRLRRSGTTFTGFASLDGVTWTQLGTATIAGFPATAYFGLATASRNPAVVTTVQFRNLGPTASTTTGAYLAGDREPLGPFTRGTGLVISEVMYHPATDASGRNLEFVEIYNAADVLEDLTDMRLGGEIDYTFPADTKLQAGEFLVIPANLSDFRAQYPGVRTVGPFAGALNNGGGRVELRGSARQQLFEIEYANGYPWPIAPAGAGHSLVLARPSYGPTDSRAWTASSRVGGSPGLPDPLGGNPLQPVVINEWLAHTDDPQLDFLELYNASNDPVDLSGCILTDDPQTNRFRVPSGTLLAPRGLLSFDQNQLGFRLNAAGESLYLINPAGTRVVDAVRFGPQENGVSSGRQPDGAATQRRLATPTSGSANDRWRSEDIVISELMYSPLRQDSAEEYVELYNRSNQAVDLADWRFTAGIEFQFPAGSRIGPGQYVVVAKSAARILTNYPNLTPATVVGDFSGTLSNSGETVALAKPDVITSTNQLGEVRSDRVYINVSEVRYGTGGRWGKWADGGGSSLELVDLHADPLRAANWADSDESQKAPWTSLAVTNSLTLGNQPANRLHIGLLGAGEALVDEVEVMRNGSTNLLTDPGFETGTWKRFGNHSASTFDTVGQLAGTRALHIRAQGDGDTGPNTIRQVLKTGLSSGNSGVIRANVRWIAGWPEILFRLHGNWLELAGRMEVPLNLGTPGAPNSRSVANAGPAIYDVTHTPGAPIANEAVKVTVRVSDPDGLQQLRLVYRIDPATSQSSAVMRDDGSGGDQLAGDGLYTATLSGRPDGTLVAFRVEATDNATTNAVSVFPAPPTSEALIRWGDPTPFGTLATYHLWNVQAVDTARGIRTGDGANGSGLNNTFRDCTLVYGRQRVIYNAGFRDKGSPFHGGYGDLATTVPGDDMLFGVTDRILALTGNGGEEETQMRTQVANWIARKMGIPYLHGHYIHVYRNGGRQATISEDLEQPNGPYARRWFVDDGDGDLYKIAVWFEFNDDNGGFDATGATLGSFRANGRYHLPRYRWNWQLRAQDSANNYTNLFDLVATVNASDYAARMPQQIDMDQWMRVFAFNRVVGNWDSYTFNVGQNMFVYQAPGLRWHMMPWDVDFVLGLGEGPTTPLGGNGLGGGNQDGDVGNRFYDTAAFRRMLFRGHLDAANGPLSTAAITEQVDARRRVLADHGITASNPSTIITYANQRRNYILQQINARNTNSLVITSNSGNDITTASPQIILTGKAPFAAESLEINGDPHPVTWTDERTFSLVVPLSQVTNTIEITGVGRNGQLLTNGTDRITIINTGAIPRVENHLVINELHYNPAAPNSSFIELYNSSTATGFGLGGFRIEGIDYTFPDGAFIAANSYLVLAKDRAAFAAAYGNTVAVYGEFKGSLDNGGERVAVYRPGGSDDSTAEALVTDVRYDNRLPWPEAADGHGPSLQLLDPLRGSWRVGNWGSAATNDSVRVTPGKINNNRSTLDSFPALWLNELLIQNQSGPVDNAGEHEPFVELYNADPAALDLSGYYLSDTYTNLTKWSFPAGTTIGPGGWLVVWADGQPEQFSAGAPHTSFRLNGTNAIVALSRLRSGAPEVLDYLEYRNSPRDRSYGSYPDGDPRNRRSFFHVTPGVGNNPVFPALDLRINEFMAQNTTTITNSVTGQGDDWFELFNAGTTAVDLSGYFLTDDPTNRVTQFRIPTGNVVPAGGFLLVWADNKASANAATNSELHVNFTLRREGEQLALFDPSQNLVDRVDFGPQTNDVSMGRYPDGAAGGATAFATATPGQPNFLPGGNLPPVLDPIGHQSGPELVPLSFTASASDANAGQALTFALEPGAPAGATLHPTTGRFSWTPGEEAGPGLYAITVRVTDNGSPARFDREQLNLTVTEVNQAPLIDPVADQMIDEGDILNFAVTGRDQDRPPQTLTYSLGGAVPPGAAIDPNTGIFSWRPNEAQGGASYAFEVRVSDPGNPSLTTGQTVSVAVAEVDNPPFVEAIQPQIIRETQPLAVAITATDPDQPPHPFTLTLEGAPEGMILSGSTLQWTPTEAQGPGDYSVTVRATQDSSGLSSARTFGIHVDELNTRPTLAPLLDLTVTGGDIITFRANANDVDLPRQKLVYSLESAPVGATVDPATGAFRYVVPDDARAADIQLALRVADNGPGELAASQSFRLTVQPRFQVVINEIQHHPATPEAAFVELLNHSTVTAWELGGFQLRGSNLNFTFPAGSQLAPNSLLCVVQNPAAFAEAHGATIPAVGPWSGTLNPDGDTLQLIRPGSPEEVFDTVQFRHQAPWPVATGGKSVQLIDSNADNSRVANWSTSTAYIGPTNLIAMTNIWSYYTEGALPAEFAAPNFPDNDWPKGRGLIYFEPDNLGAVESLKNTALPNRGPFTLYFRTRFNLSNAPTQAKLVLNSILDDGMVVHLNGRPVFYQNIDTNAMVDANTPAIAVVGNAARTGPFVISATNLFAGENVVAVEVHQQNSGSSDMVFGLSLDLSVFTTPGATPGAANNVVADLEPFPSLWINEILPRNTSGISDSAGQREPWLELVNTGLTAIALDDWFLTDSYLEPGKWRFPDGTTILPGAYFLVFADGRPQRSTPSEPHTSFRISDQGGSVALARRQFGIPQIVDYLDYPMLAPDTSIAARPDGQSLARIHQAPPTPRMANAGSPTNRPPNIPFVGTQIVPEESVLNFDLAATDPDPGQSLKYSIMAGPSGLEVSAAGWIQWTPTESQGPSTNTVRIRATDTGLPPLYTELDFEIVVTEANQSPSLSVAGERTAAPGQLLLLTLIGVDPDLPVQHLQYFLLSGPANTLLDPASGTLTWTPGLGQLGTQPFTVIVQDPLGARATNSFSVEVVTSGNPPKVTISRDSGQQLHLSSPTQPGARYRFEWKVSLTMDAWKALPDFTATTGNIILEEQIQPTEQQRYYRLVRLP